MSVNPTEVDERFNALIVMLFKLRREIVASGMPKNNNLNKLLLHIFFLIINYSYFSKEKLKQQIALILNQH